jgi:hypothetical protein
VLLDHPADITGLHSINCYFVEVEDAALGADGKKFKSIRSACCTRSSGNTTPRRPTCTCSSCAIRGSDLTSSLRCCSAN